MSESVFIPKVSTASGLFLGWGRVDAAGNLVDQSGPVFSVSIFGAGIFTWTLVSGLAPLRAAVVQIESGSTTTQATITNDTTLTANTGASSLAHVAFFYA